MLRRLCLRKLETGILRKTGTRWDKYGSLTDFVRSDILLVTIQGDFSLRTEKLPSLNVFLQRVDQLRNLFFNLCCIELRRSVVPSEPCTSNPKPAQAYKYFYNHQFQNDVFLPREFLNFATCQPCLQLSSL